MTSSKYRGVSVRQDIGREPKFRLSFTYKGINCRESLSIPVTPANERFAGRMLAEIQLKIERGDFRYADYFPNSSKCKLFGSTATGTTVKEYVDKYIETCERRGVELSSLKAYRSNARSLKDFHDVQVKDLTAAMVRDWILRQTTLSQKSIRCRLSLMRPALDEAVTDGLMQTNPLRQIDISLYIKKAEAKTREPVDPFGPDEVEAILKAARNRSSLEYGLIAFAFETGMRTGELIALRWEDVDWIHNTVYVHRAVVERYEKGPKTEAGKRHIELSPKALEILKELRAFTELVGEHVFLCPLSMERWVDSNQIRKVSWRHVLKLAKVRYRKPYNTRHSFATKHISKNANIWWLAKQLGHRSPEMLFKHYGAFIKEYEKDSAKTGNLLEIARQSPAKA